MTARARSKEARRRPAARAAAVAMASATLVGMGVQPSSAAGRAPDGPLVPVIVEGAADAAAVQVLRLGGVVDQRLSILDGLHARVPVDGIAVLAEIEGVRAVTPDGQLVALDQEWGDDDTHEDEQASQATGRWEADHDLGSTHTTAKRTGAENVWSQSDPADGNRKLTGHGVGVALIDTGVTPVPGLDGAGKVVNGPDLSLDSQGEGTRYLDGYGHGTHMAGIIAGRDRTTPVGGENDKQYFVGMAPDARIINVKAGAADGAVDVSQVLAAIDWVVTNRASHNIRVLNLAYGTESTQAPSLDPLAHAVESAWRAGIVVVVAAGNDGEEGPQPLDMPAIDPFVIAVGSSDHLGSDNRDQHVVAPWTNSGTDARRPDLLAPGKSVVSLRVPGSFADVGHPEGLVTGDAAGRLFRGSGTSQSAAVVSGAAALLLQQNPRLTPDQVKGVLMANADRLRADGSPVQGAGVLDVKGAHEQIKSGNVPAYTQQHARSTGTGSLEASRGGSSITDPGTLALLTGEQDIFGAVWDAPSWAAASSAGTAWLGGTWRGTRWAGDSWLDGAWPGVDWSGASWSGASWSEREWSRMSWRADEWQRMSWRDDDWSRMSWRSDDWSRMSWRTAEQW